MDEPDNPVFPTGCDTPEVLVISEQLTANAIRCALLARGYEKIRVLSFYEMDAQEMAPGNRRLDDKEI